MGVQDPDLRRAFVLDTNVVMHDPAAIFRFEEHDIYIPMIVLEELDAGKKGVSEAARNVRQVSRFLDELMAHATKEQIDRGLELPAGRCNHGKKVMGIERSTFLIDAAGVLRAEWRKVKVPGHVDEVLAAVKALGKP